MLGGAKSKRLIRRFTIICLTAFLSADTPALEKINVLNVD